MNLTTTVNDRCRNVVHWPCSNKIECLHRVRRYLLLLGVTNHVGHTECEVN